MGFACNAKFFLMAGLGGRRQSGVETLSNRRASGEPEAMRQHGLSADSFKLRPSWAVLPTRQLLENTNDFSAS